MKFERRTCDPCVVSDPLFNNRENKLKIIQDICECLNIQNSYTAVEVERSLVEATCEKLLSIKTEVKEQFGIPLGEEKDSGKTTTIKRGVKLLNAVLSRWGFTQIKTGKRQKKRVDGKEMDITPFEIHFKNEHGRIITEGIIQDNPFELDTSEHVDMYPDL